MTATGYPTNHLSDGTLESSKPSYAQAALREAEVRQAFCATYGRQATVTGEGAPLDCVFTDGEQITAVAEIKARNNTLADFQRWGSGILSASKIHHGMAAARALRVPFIAVLGTSDDALLVWVIANANGKQQFPMIPRTQETRGNLSTPFDRKQDVVVTLPLTAARITKK